MRFTRIIAVGSITMAMTSGLAVADHHEEKKKDESAQKAGYAEKQNIVATAQSAGQFKTLLAAAQAAGLADALQGEGPLTVFAPTDEAFAKLPAGTVDELLKPENKEKLAAILSYHVVRAKATSKDVAGMTEVKTLGGQTLAIKSEDGKVMVGSAQVTKADVMASNGVIHVIDTVLIPEQAAKQ